jgi:hypothetical protein
MVAHRVSSKRWMAALDNQLKSSALPTGLATFAPSASGEAPWDNSRQWPHFTMSLDLGSDGLSGYMALERKFKLKCDKIPDASHAANRDMIFSLQQAGLDSLWLRGGRAQECSVLARVMGLRANSCNGMGAECKSDEHRSGLSLACRGGRETKS